MAEPARLECVAEPTKPRAEAVEEIILTPSVPLPAAEPELKDMAGKGNEQEPEPAATENRAPALSERSAEASTAKISDRTAASFPAGADKSAPDRAPNVPVAGPLAPSLPLGSGKVKEPQAATKPAPPLMAEKKGHSLQAVEDPFVTVNLTPRQNTLVSAFLSMNTVTRSNLTNIKGAIKALDDVATNCRTVAGLDDECGKVSVEYELARQRQLDLYGALMRVQSAKQRAGQLIQRDRSLTAAEKRLQGAAKELRESLEWAGKETEAFSDYCQLMERMSIDGKGTREAGVLLGESAICKLDECRALLKDIALKAPSRRTVACVGQVRVAELRKTLGRRRVGLRQVQLVEAANGLDGQPTVAPQGAKTFKFGSLEMPRPMAPTLHADAQSKVFMTPPSSITTPSTAGPMSPPPVLQKPAETAAVGNDTDRGEAARPFGIFSFGPIGQQSKARDESLKKSDDASASGKLPPSAEVGAKNEPAVAPPTLSSHSSTFTIGQTKAPHGSNLTTGEERDKGLGFSFSLGLSSTTEPASRDPNPPSVFKVNLPKVAPLAASTIGQPPPPQQKSLFATAASPDDSPLATPSKSDPFATRPQQQHQQSPLAAVGAGQESPFGAFGLAPHSLPAKPLFGIAPVTQPSSASSSGFAAFSGTNTPATSFSALASQQQQQQQQNNQADNGKSKKNLSSSFTQFRG